MAVSTVRPETANPNGASGEQDEDETTTPEKAKREKVDLEALAPDARVPLNIFVPASLKLELTKRGEADGVSATAWARDQLANLVGIEIPASFAERTRVHKYNSEEERKAATAARASERNALIKALMAKVKSGDIDLSALGIEQN